VRSFSDLAFEKPATTRAASLPPADGLYIALTGSRDDEFSLDATMPDGVRMGLFTAKLLAKFPPAPTVRSPITMTYEQLMREVSVDVANQALIWKNNQNPQLRADYGNPRAVIFSTPTAAMK
jgi:hypothetical protein